MNYADMPYEAPAWLRAQIVRVAAMPGYSFEGDMVAKGAEWQMQTDRLVAEYFADYLSDPSATIANLTQFSKRFTPINDNANILTPVVPDQFGALANIASLRYRDCDKTGKLASPNALRPMHPNIGSACCKLALVLTGNAYCSAAS
jgi:hypothetical protein